MGVALTLEVAPSRNVARLRGLCLALPAVGLWLSALHLAGGPTRLIDGSAALHASLAFALGVAGLALALRGGVEWRARASDAAGRMLIVDDSGAVTVSPEPGRAAVPAELRATCTLPGLIVLVLAPYPANMSSAGPGRPVTLLLGRDGMPDHVWRRLHVWLQWMERGRHAAPSSGPHRT